MLSKHWYRSSPGEVFGIWWWERVEGDSLPSWIYYQIGQVSHSCDLEWHTLFFLLVELRCVIGKTDQRLCLSKGWLKECIHTVLVPCLFREMMDGLRRGKGSKYKPGTNSGTPVLWKSPLCLTLYLASWSCFLTFYLILFHYCALNALL